MTVLSELAIAAAMTKLEERVEFLEQEMERIARYNSSDSFKKTDEELWKEHSQFSRTVARCALEGRLT